jgi:hypothetical protein
LWPWPLIFADFPSNSSAEVVLYHFSHVKKCQTIGVFWVFIRQSLAIAVSEKVIRKSSFFVGFQWAKQDILKIRQLIFLRSQPPSMRTGSLILSRTPSFPQLKFFQSELPQRAEAQNIFPLVIATIPPPFEA